MNSREKGKRGERRWRDELRAHGFEARRGQQFSGSPDSPDVVCEALDWLHFEVKHVERLNVWDAYDQAKRDARGKTLAIAHTRNFRPWLVTIEAETFFALLRGELPAEPGTRRTERTDATPHPGPVTHSLPLVRLDGPSPTRIPPAASQPAGVPDRGGEGEREKQFSGVSGESPDTAGGSPAPPGQSNNHKTKQTEQ